MDNKITDNRAWLLVLPAFLLVAFNAILPFMTVVNYSFQDVFGMKHHVFVGWEFYKAILHDGDIQRALLRQIIFSVVVLAIEIPLGIAVSLTLPTKGRWVGIVLVIVALPILIPWNVVGVIWEIFARGDIGLGGAVINALGINYNYTQNPIAAWCTVVIMDVWHWTSLVVLLCYAGLRAIPDAYYQAARIDGASRWATFRFIELPRLRGVLTIAILLRFVYSFKIYAEPFVMTGGGPGNSTTFLSQMLDRIALGQLDVGRAGAFAILYFLIILLVSYIFYNVLTRVGQGQKRASRGPA